MPETPAPPISHPMILAPWEVRGILGGRITQLRRPVKPSNSTVLGYEVGARNSMWAGLDFSQAWVDRGWPVGWTLQHVESPDDVYPFGYLHVAWCHPADLAKDGYSDGIQYRVRSKIEPGDEIWVKETWAIRELLEGCWVEFPNGETITIPRQSVDHATINTPDEDHWSSPAIMPRWASRLSLTLLSVRPERVSDVTDADVDREGIELWRASLGNRASDRDCRYLVDFSRRTEGPAGKRGVHASYWDVTFGRKDAGLRWAAGGWTWVYGVKAITKTESGR